MRFRVDVVRGEWLCVNGPDAERTDEHLVVEVATGRVVLRFEEYGNWPYMAEQEFAGTREVQVDLDERGVTVLGHSGSRRRVPLPES